MSDITVDVREFRRVAGALLTQTTRSTVDFINGQMFGVSVQAIKQTANADPRAIERLMGTVQRTERLRAGAKSSGAGYSRVARDDWAAMEGTFAARIVNAKRRARGEKTIWGRELGESARKLTAGKVRSVQFIRSGWLPAVQRLGALVYQRGATMGAKQRGRPKGDVSPARVRIKFGMTPITCTIENTALLTEGKHSLPGGKSGNPMPIAESGLRAALAIQTRDMARHYLRKMGTDLRPYGVTAA